MTTKIGDVFKLVVGCTKVDREIRELQAARLTVLIEEMQSIQSDLVTIARMEDTIGEIMSLICSVSEEATPDEGEALLSRIPVLIGEYEELSKGFKASIKQRFDEEAKRDPQGAHDAMKRAKNAIRKNKRGWGSKKLS